MRNLGSRIEEKFILTRNEKKYIEDYLVTVQYWCYYDLSLYGNVIDIFDAKSIKNLSNMVIERASYFKSIPENKKLIAQVLMNTVSELLNKDERDEAIRFHKLVEGLLEETDIFSRTVSYFLAGEIEYYGGMSSGKEKMEDAIGIFETVGSDRLASQYREDYEELLEKFEKS